MTDQVKGLRFDIYERIDLSEDVEGITEWEEIELTPHIQLSTTGSQAILHGHLMLAGVYVGDQSRQNNRLEHAIPVEITLPLKRIASIDEVSVEIDNFDIEILSARRINVNGVLALGGVETENVESGNHDKGEKFQPIEPSFVNSGDSQLVGAKTPEPLLSAMMRKEKTNQAKTAKKREDKATSNIAAEVELEHRSESEQRQDDIVQDFAMNRLRDQAKQDLLTSSLQEGIVRAEPNTIAQANDHRNGLKPNDTPVKQAAMQQSEQQATEQPHDEQREIEEQNAEKEPFDEQLVAEQMPSPQLQIMEQMTVAPETTYASSLQVASDSTAQHSTSSLEIANISSEVATQTDQPSTDQLFEHAEDSFDSFEQAENNTEEKTSDGIKIAFSSHKGESAMEAHVLQQQLAMQREEGELAEQSHTDHVNEDSLEVEAERLQDQHSDAPDTEWKNFLLSRDTTEERHFSKVRMCIVQKEDTLDTIAERYQLNPREIILYNRLSDQQLDEGQIVYIPNLSS